MSWRIHTWPALKHILTHSRKHEVLEAGQDLPDPEAGPGMSRQNANNHHRRTPLFTKHHKNHTCVKARGISPLPNHPKESSRISLLVPGASLCQPVQQQTHHCCLSCLPTPHPAPCCTLPAAPSPATKQGAIRLSTLPSQCTTVSQLHTI